jgi:DNA polymerase-3 subunit epsilon
VECPSELEAEVRELRLIAEHRPRYNRRSKFPEKASWLKLTVEAFPRLSLVRRVLDDGAVYLGPFSSSRSAEMVLAALHEALRLRQCSKRLSVRTPSAACVLAEMGRCGAPCLGHLEGESVEMYAVHADAFRELVRSDPHPVVSRLSARVSALASAQRYEDASVARDRLVALVRAVARLQRIVSLTSVPELVAARPTPSLGWELVVVRHGRLAGASVVPRGADPRPYVEALLATAETVLPGPGPLPASTAEEVGCVLRWLETDGVRLVQGSWASPARGAAGLRAWLGTVASADPFRDSRALRPLARPARAS